jgi:hypothetical protein
VKIVVGASVLVGGGDGRVGASSNPTVAGSIPAEIARSLVLSEKTVRNHVANILSKLQAPDRAAAVARARDAGIGRP